MCVCVGEHEGEEWVVLRPWGCQSAQVGCFLTHGDGDLSFLLTQMPAFSCRFRGFILLITFFIYTCYHMSRKPISVVKVRLALGVRKRAGNAGPKQKCTSVEWSGTRPRTKLIPFLRSLSLLLPLADPHV